MTERHGAYLVVLDHDIREDDAEATINALRMVRGVVDVRPVNTDPIAATGAEIRLKAKLAKSLYHWIGTELR
jgi:hypothetical protein